MCTSTGQRAANGTNAVNSSALRDDAVAVGHLAGARMSVNRLPPVRSAWARASRSISARARGQIRIAVDLAVRMGQRHADLLAAVLEAEHVRDARARHQIGGAVRAMRRRRGARAAVRAG
mgnify:CR=1 FL=1